MADSVFGKFLVPFQDCEIIRTRRSLGVRDPSFRRRMTSLTPAKSSGDAIDLISVLMSKTLTYLSYICDTNIFSFALRFLYLLPLPNVINFHYLQHFIKKSKIITCIQNNIKILFVTTFSSLMLYLSYFMKEQILS